MFDNPGLRPHGPLKRTGSPWRGYCNAGIQRKGPPPEGEEKGSNRRRFRSPYTAPFTPAETLSNLPNRWRTPLRIRAHPRSID